MRSSHEQAASVSVTVPLADAPTTESAENVNLPYSVSISAIGPVAPLTETPACPATELTRLAVKKTSPTGKILPSILKPIPRSVHLTAPAVHFTPRLVQMAAGVVQIVPPEVIAAPQTVTAIPLGVQLIPRDVITVPPAVIIIPPAVITAPPGGNHGSPSCKSSSDSR